MKEGKLKEINTVNKNLKKINYTYDNKIFCEVIFKGKNSGTFPYKFYFLIPDDKEDKVIDIIKSEFFKNNKLVKFINSNNIIINKYLVYINKENFNCFEVSEFFGDLYLKNDSMNKEFLNKFKVFYIKNLSIKKYLKKIFLYFYKTENIELLLDKFTKKELLKIKKILIEDLKNKLIELEKNVFYNKDFGVYNMKYRILVLVKLRLDKLIEINDFLKNYK